MSNRHRFVALIGLLAAGGMVSAALPGDPRADERDLRVLVDKEDVLGFQMHVAIGGLRVDAGGRTPPNPQGTRQPSL